MCLRRAEKKEGISQGDENKITSGKEEATPHLHREGLSCAVEVPSTRGSREGEPPPPRQPPLRHNQLTDLKNNIF